MTLLITARYICRYLAYTITNHNPALAMILPQRLHEKQHLLLISLCCDLSVFISTLYETAQGFWRLGWILRMRTYRMTDC